jgi:dienelactone hydrolase
VLAAFGSTTTIPSYPIIEKRPADVAIEVWGSENQSPRGGVVLLHGCNGYGAGSIPDWAEWFVERGYVAAAVDSFSTRGIREVCRSGGKMLMRVGDAYVY